MPTTDDGWGGAKPIGNNPATGPDWQPTELRIGEVYGARTFEVTPDGWLMGVTYKKIWTPGINTSECWKVTGWNVPGVGISDKFPTKKYESRPTGVVTKWGGEDRHEFDTVIVGYAWHVDGVDGYSVEEPAPVYGTNDTGHRMEYCECGWHGYLYGSLNFAVRQHAVSGIVRASGMVRMCERGFRATQAEIVALFMPEVDPGRTLDPIVRRESMRNGFLGTRALRADRAVKVRERYPNVPMYTDLDAMLADWPTEPPRPKLKAIEPPRDVA